MKIKKVGHEYHAKTLEQAFASNFVDMPVLSLSKDGKVVGYLEEKFLLSGLLGLNNSWFAVGVTWENGNFMAQGINVNDDDFVSYLHGVFERYPGVREVWYSSRDVGGVCYVVSIHWDFGIEHGIRQALGAVYQTKSGSSIFKTITPVDFNRSEFSKSALSKYLEFRRRVEPNAVELRFDVAALPDLLGLRAERAVEYAAEAAFGKNGGVDCAIYVRGGFGSHLARGDIVGLTEGNDLKFKKGIRCLESLRSDLSKKTQQLPAVGKAVDVLASHGYSLGSNVFEVVDSIGEFVCQAEELFRHEHVVPAGFDSQKFAEAMRELVVNSFCHGHWEVTEHGRDDNDHNRAARLAIVHASNRLEVINQLRPVAGYYHPQSGCEHAIRRSALHDAFRDIGFAKGRSLGLKLVRRRLSSLGFFAPIFIRQRDSFRAVIPLSRQLDRWVFSTPALHSASALGEAKKEIGRLYALQLSILLREVDQDIIANSLYIPPSEAVKILEELFEKGVLLKNTPRPIWLGRSYSKYLMPSYVISSDEKASEAASDIAGRMSFMPVQANLSIGALYQLSTWSMAHLQASDLERVIFDIFASEILNLDEARRLARVHIETLRENRALLYPDL